VSDDMEFYETVSRRRSVREFQPRPVEAEKLRRVLEAGLKAPSHNHLREWEFILLKDVERRKETDPRKVRVSEVMSSPLIAISEGASVEEAAEKMRNDKIRRLVVEENQKILGIIAEADMIRVAPELHFLIRERSKLEVQLIPTKPHGMTFAGFCEDCGNYSNDLRNVSGEWLCEECSHYARA